LLLLFVVVAAIVVGVGVIVVGSIITCGSFSILFVELELEDVNVGVNPVLCISDLMNFVNGVNVDGPGGVSNVAPK